jgi:hypothetical protein
MKTNMDIKKPRIKYFQRIWNHREILGFDPHIEFFKKQICVAFTFSIFLKLWKQMRKRQRKKRKPFLINMS